MRDHEWVGAFALAYIELLDGSAEYKAIGLRELWRLISNQHLMPENPVVANMEIACRSAVESLSTRTPVDGWRILIWCADNTISKP